MSAIQIKPLPNISHSDARRFWKFVSKASADQCWLWTGARKAQGYGNFTVKDGASQRFLIATRVAWLLSKGSDPYPLIIRHKCDNPPCCNPTHLIPGTDSENQIDMAERGTMPWRKLTYEMVDEIRTRLAHGQTQSSIATMYKVSQGAITDIKRGANWRHHQTTKAVKLADIDHIVRFHHMLTINGMTRPISEWANHVGLSHATISMRLSRGWNSFDAVFKPLNHRGRPRSAGLPL